MKASDSPVRAWEETVRIPTYRRGPEDKNPPLLIERKSPIHPGSSIIYPYPLQENLSTEKEDREWKALFLENEFLLITVLPQLGGRLLSVMDKTTGEEALYRNHVLKFARIGIRGAWVSGGIEWNFPNGHTVTTSSPIDYTLKENNDGSKTLVIGDIEKVSRMKWSVLITLYPRHSFFETQVRLFNRTPLPHRFWFWANSAAPATPGLEFITTATKVMTLTDIMDFPVHRGVDLRWDRNHLEPQDLFSLNSSCDFVGWYNHDLQKGLVHYADRYEARGRKFYTWGQSDEGRIWVDLLTEQDGPYSEMQSGRLSTQRVWDTLPPYSAEKWNEYWYPIHKIGTPVFANREAAVSLAPISKTKLRLGVESTSPIPGAVLSLETGRTKLWKEKRDLRPGAPVISEIEIEDSLGEKAELVLTVTDRRGKEVVRYEAPGKNRHVPGIKWRYKLEPTLEAGGAEELWKNGLDYEKTGDMEKAEKAYRKALTYKKEFSQPRCSLAVLYLRRGDWKQAISELKKVLKKDKEDEKARFFLGTGYLYKGDTERALEEFELLTRAKMYGASGMYLAGGIYLGKGMVEKARQKLEKSVGINPENLDARALLACTYRKSGHTTEAKKIVQDILKNDPLSFLALAENLFSSEIEDDGNTYKEKKEEFKKILRSEAQSYLELSTVYANFALYQEAIKILSFYLDETKQNGKHPYP
ncbi:MAG: DUF5107 domain-containing protein, partial [Spirochaetota bacterium]